MKIEKLYQLFKQSTGVCTDTRRLEKNNLFFALTGPHFDGNQFAEKALDLGALAVIVNSDTHLPHAEGKVYRVDNTLQSLQDLAQHHRKISALPIIALTGSNGKTTTKELIRSVLEKKYKVLATVGNLNNHIGVPLTLLQITSEHEIAIIEMGANHLGEIRTLSNITLPNWGYITNFGKAHLEGFGSFEGVIRGKSELYEHLIKHHQKILVNGDDALQIAATKGNTIMRFGKGKENHFHWNSINNSSKKELTLEFQNHIFKSSLYGDYNLNNIAAAIAFGYIFDVSVQSIQEAISQFTSENNRSQEIRIGKCHIILDAYNANPTSMTAALNAFTKKSTINSALILGDMKELGSAAEKEHQDIVNLALQLNIKTLYLIGDYFNSTTIDNDRIVKHTNVEMFLEDTTPELLQYDFILIKGSRSMALERIVTFLKTGKN